MLRTHCCRHKCFPVCPRAQHLLPTQKMFLILFRNILCLRQMFDWYITLSVDVNVPLVREQDCHVRSFYYSSQNNTVSLHTFAVLYCILSVTSNMLSWTKASACQTMPNNATVTLIALLILYAHIRVNCHA